MLVLHRLEGCDGPAELHAHHRISQGILAQPLRATDHFICQADRRLVHCPGERRGGSACFSASVPALSMAPAASTVVAKNGAHNNARPISSSTMQCSPKPKPWPP